MRDTELKMAVFIDFDNIEIGVKTTLGGRFDVGAVLEALKERGEVVSKIAYGDWKRSDDYSRSLSQHAVKMVQRNLTPGGDKNGADINLALDALEMAFRHGHINAFVIVGGDSDFITLVEKLHQYDKKVLVVGGRAFTSVILQRNCHEFIAYENLVSSSQSSRRRTPRGRASSQAPLQQVLPLVRRALKVLADREVSPQLGLLKSTLLQLDSTFSERTYGSSSFRDFAEKLAKAGLVSLKTTGRTILVEARDAETADVEPGDAEAREGEPREGESRDEVEAKHADSGQTEEAAASPAGDTASPGSPQREPRPSDPERIAAGIAEVRRLFASSTASPRWPLYVRQVKQLLRSTDRSFDERQYGVESLVELLRGCQRDGFIRLERDRRGVLRVYPGDTMGRPTELPLPTSAETGEGEETPAEVGSAGSAAEVASVDPALAEAPTGAPAQAGDAQAPTPKAKRKTTRTRKTASGGRTTKTAKTARKSVTKTARTSKVVKTTTTARTTKAAKAVKTTPTASSTPDE